MYGNIPEDYRPNQLPELSFGLSEFDYVYNTDTLNATRMLLGDASEIDDGATVFHLPDSGRTVTYGNVRSAVQRCAGAFTDLGVEAGDRILWRLENSLPAFVIQLAAWQIGAINVPSAPVERAREVAHFLNDTEARLVVATTKDFDEVQAALSDNATVEHVVAVGENADDVAADYEFDALLAESTPRETYASTDPFDAASIYHTGGTTGLPKGCLASHAEELANADAHGRSIGMDAEDVMYSMYPVGHAAGNSFSFLTPVRFGASAVLTTRPSPREIVEHVQRYRPTIFYCQGSITKQILDDFNVGTPKFESIRMMRVSYMGGESWVDEWETKTGIRPLNSFGCTPMRGLFISTCGDGEQIAPKELLGRPINGYEAKVIDIEDHDVEVERGERGQLAVRGPTGIAYWTNLHPSIEQTQREDVHDGWSVIDDVFKLDENGNLRWIERVDSMIMSSGRNIAPAEVMEVLSYHEAIKDVAVLGVPHEERGEITKAFVVLEEDIALTESLTEDIQTFAKENMAPYKYPREIVAVSEIPRGKTGKIQYDELR